MTSSHIDIQSVSSASDPSTCTTQILDILQKVLDNAQSSDQAAEDAASQIDQLFQENQSSSKETEDFIWKLWALYIEVAKKVPATDERQTQLVRIIEKLQPKNGTTIEIWGQKAVMWKDLALLGPNMRDAWNINVKHDGSEADKDNIKEWVSLNSFAARLYGNSLQSWINLGIWELRAGLEEPLSSSSAKQMHLSTACEWLLHAGKELRQKSTKPDKLDDFEAKMLRSGSLLDGQTGPTEERWQFWKKRLSELAPEAESEDLKKRIEEVVEYMGSLES